MKKTKILVIMSLVLSLLVGAIPNVGTSVEAASNIPDVKVAFINVCDEKASEKEAGKADATVIEANNEMVLVDCGEKRTFEHLRARLIARYKKMVGSKQNEKVVLKEIVITHNHSDHMGALASILADTENFEVKKVCYANICEQCTKSSENCTCKGPEKTNLQKIENAIAKRKGLKIKKMKALPEASKRDKDDLEPYEIDLGDTRVEVYRPISKSDYIRIHKLETKNYEDGCKTDDQKAKAKEKHYTLWANNRSMIVRVVKTKEVDGPNNKKQRIAIKDGMTALLLGDLYINGIYSAKNVYGDKIFNKEYEVCKVGHHGFRSSGFWGQSGDDMKKWRVEYSSSQAFWKDFDENNRKTLVNAEIAFYNSNICAKSYVFNVTDDKVQNTSEGTVKRYNKLAAKEKLKYIDEKGQKVASTCTKYGSVFRVDSSNELHIHGTVCKEIKNSTK